MTAMETSASIAAWAESTFGAARSLDDLAARAIEELNELRAALAADEPASEVTAEAADVAILLHRIAALCGADLAAIVDQKMAINRARRWQPAGDGTGRHID
ncbi:MAG: DUF550 domain-containing protein [Tabrizicola sp.]|nr:DUF550 domain-containing protein [Tabrizicola sp.]